MKIVGPFGHMGKYFGLIQNYIELTAQMEELLRKYVAIIWTNNCFYVFVQMKPRKITTPILAFLYCENIFHMNVDASGITQKIL